jgi:hypothetical protein
MKGVENNSGGFASSHSGEFLYGPTRLALTAETEGMKIETRERVREENFRTCNFGWFISTIIVAHSRIRIRSLLTVCPNQ